MSIHRPLTEAAVPLFATLSDREGQLSKLAPGVGTAAATFLVFLSPADPGPGPAADLEEAVPELVGGQFGVGIGDPLAVEADRTLRDLPGAFLVGLRPGRPGPGGGPGGCARPSGARAAARTRGRRRATSCFLNTWSKAASAAVAGAVAVVEVDDRPGQEPLGGVGVELPRGQPGGLGLDPVGVPAGGQQHVPGQQASRGCS